jgi:predicted Fe-Mo cluster-binding NifX family protein
MKIAIPVFDTKISPRFDSSQEFILLEVEQSRVIERKQLNTKGWPLAAKVKQLVESGVDTLICGGIDRPSMQHLSFNGLKVYSWVTGEVEDAITCFLDNGLESGSILGKRGAPQGRWLFCERRNHLCNMAQTEYRCEGKEVMRMPAGDGTGPQEKARGTGKCRGSGQAGISGKKSGRGKGRGNGPCKAGSRQDGSRGAS